MNSSSITNLLLASSLSFMPLGVIHAMNEAPREYKISLSESTEWVQDLVDKYAELNWLADENVKMTEENKAVAKDSSWSKELYGKMYPEFDRTMMTILSLRTILEGSDHEYKEFVSKQPESIRLEKESFYDVQHQALEIVRNFPGITEKEMRKTIEIALVLGDMGKTQKARVLVENKLCNDVERADYFALDHDDFYSIAIRRCPEIFSAYKDLCPQGQELIKKVANLAHFGHISHLEGGHGMFTKLKNSNILNDDEMAFDFEFFVHSCDVAGALGHVSNTSSITFNQNTFKTFEAVKEACKKLKDGDESDAYNCYLSKRASWLGLDPTLKEGQVLTRIGAMLRLYTKKEGEILQQGMNEISYSELQLITDQLTLPNAKEDILRTPTYMPAVLVNLSNNKELGETKEIRLKEAIRIGLPFIAKVLRDYRVLVQNGILDIDTPLNFNQIAGVVKTNPFDLLDKDYKINNEYEVTIVD